MRSRAVRWCRRSAKAALSHQPEGRKPTGIYTCKSAVPLTGAPTATGPVGPGPIRRWKDWCRWRELHNPSKTLIFQYRAPSRGLGLGTKAHCAALTLAESDGRTLDRLHPPGMLGPRHRFQRGTSVPHSHGLPELSSSSSHAQVSGTGLPGTACGRTARPGQNHRTALGSRTPPPLRSSGGGCRHLLPDRDAKFSAGFDQILESLGVKPVRLPPHSPNLIRLCVTLCL